MKRARLLFAFLFFTLIPFMLFAQNEIEREQISLEGLQEFGFTANIQGPELITDADILTPAAIRKQSVEQLTKADLRYVSDEEVESSADIPFLYMHINTMQLENGLVPFSIELRLYQPVKLVLNRDLQTSASTWEYGTVGLVSHDQIQLIIREAQNLLAVFIDDYRKSNRR